jgi:hypothetical protein
MLHHVTGCYVTVSAHLVVPHPHAAISQAEAEYVVKEGLGPMMAPRRAKHLRTNNQFIVQMKRCVLLAWQWWPCGVPNICAHMT